MKVHDSSIANQQYLSLTRPYTLPLSLGRVGRSGKQKCYVTDRPTDGPTDTASSRVASLRLKRQFFSMPSVSLLLISSTSADFVMNKCAGADFVMNECTSADIKANKVV